MERDGFLAKLPRLGKCCCCIELRSGVIVLGVLGIFGCVSNLVQLILIDKAVERQKLEINGISESDAKTYVTAKIVSEAVSLMVTFVLVLLLLIGAIQRKVLLLKIYVIFNMICIGIVGVLAVIMFIFVPPIGILMLVYLAIALYYLFCVNSYLQELLDEQYRVVHRPIAFKPA